MGFEIAHVLSDECHYGSFVCAICQNLCGLDALVTTGCSHVFCHLCLETWLSRSSTQSDTEEDNTIYTQFFQGPTNTITEKRCPTCNRDLSYQSNAPSSGKNSNGISSSKNTMHSSFMMMANQSVHVRPLEEVQPLAYRVLFRIQVNCPLHEKHGCPWKGDYGDVQEHLISATAHQEQVAFNEEEQEELRKEKTRTTKTNNTSLKSSTTPRHITTQQLNTEEEMDTGEEDDEAIEEVFPIPRMKRNEYTGDDNTTTRSQQQQNDIDARQQEQDQQQRRRRRDLATSFKEEANTMFANRNYKQAKDLYSKALSVIMEKSPRQKSSYATSIQDDYDNNSTSTNQDDCYLLSTLYCNRAATHLKLQEYTSCINDCRVAIQLNPQYIKAYMRLSNALVWIGQFDEAYEELSLGCSRNQLKLNSSTNNRNTNNKQLQKELQHVQQLRDSMALGLQQLNQKDYAPAKATFGALLRHSNAKCVLMCAARADVGLGLTDSALRLTLQIIRQLDKNYAEAYEVRGQCMFLMGDLDKGMSLVKEALRLDPDLSSAQRILKQCKKVSTNIQTARNAYFRRDFPTAINAFSESIQICNPLPPKSPLYGILYSERAEAYLRIKNYSAALKDCALVLYAIDDCVKAWLVKARALGGLGRYEEARSDMESLLQKWGSNNDEIVKAYEKADFEVRKTRRPDFYKLFQIPHVASTMEIKKAYKDRAKEMHPDKFSSVAYTDQQRQEAETNFKLLGEGLEILCDDFMRQLYDEGYDQEAIRERVQAAQQAAHQRQGNYGRHHHRHR